MPVPFRHHHLLTLRIRESRDVARLRDKVRRIAAVCGFENLDQTRLATAASEVGRSLLERHHIGQAELGLVSGEEYGTMRAGLALRAVSAEPDAELPPFPEFLLRPDGEITRMTLSPGLRAAADLLDMLDVWVERNGSTSHAVAVRWAPDRDFNTLLDQVRSIRGQLFEDTADDYLENLQAKQQQLEELLRHSMETNAQLADSNERLERANTVKNQFLGIAAHDLRNPISNIVMVLDLLDPTLAPAVEEQQEYFEMIRLSADGMLRLLNDLLDVARIESGRFNLRTEAVPLGAFLEGIADNQRQKGMRKNTRLVVETSRAPATVPLDRDRIEQVVGNLVDNAVKYSPPGSVVRISAAAAADRVEIAVEDQGPGIPASDLPRLFTPFHRGSNKPTGGESSTGLGLAIVKMIVEAHKGTIGVSNLPAGGSRFVVMLPLNAE